MTNSVVGELYSSLSYDELKALDIYLSTSQWQYSETVINCHTCFLEACSENSLVDLNKVDIFHAVYGEEEYNDSKLRFLLNRLADAVREFVLVQQDKIGNIFIDKVWIDFLFERKLKKNIQYNMAKRQRPPSVEHKFLQKYFRSQEVSANSFAFSRDVGDQFSSILELTKSAELFSDLVFIKNYCSLLTFSIVFQAMPLQLPKDKLEEIKNKHWEVDYPEFLIYLNLLDLLLHKNDENYYIKFKNDLFANFEIWNDEEKINFLASLLNFTTGQINSGKSEYIDEQFNLFCLFEEKGIFDIKGYINAGRINNVVFIYLRKKDFLRAESFVNLYSNKLPKETQASCKHFNLARIHFETHNYKLSLRELLMVDFSHDHGYSLNSKLLLLKNYFELKETDAFESLCASFKGFVRKNKVISDNNKLLLLNFIKMAKRLYGASADKRKKLSKELHVATNIAEKAWLLEKIGVN